jgi:hypothetical protein
MISFNPNARRGQHQHQYNDITHNQFGAVENGITVTKLMQIFSRQAAMMDALISHFADQMRRRKDGTDAVDNVADDGEASADISFRLLASKPPLVSNVNRRLTLMPKIFFSLFLFHRTKSNSE